ncbi:MAG: hypothetical protein EBY38_10290, partial [Flavobacteriaceae bacterium]|nr:hypothetical protein [Flavobacteriaceae bacterium]
MSIVVYSRNRISTLKSLKIIAVIPAHMASVRFPGKILFPFFDIPMIEQAAIGIAFNGKNALEE